MSHQFDFDNELNSSESSRRSYTFLNENASKNYIGKQIIYGSIILVCQLIELIILYYSPKLKILISIVTVMGAINSFISLALVALFSILLFSNKIRFKELALTYSRVLRVLSFTPLAIYIGMCIQSIVYNGLTVYLAVIFHIFTGIHTGIMGSTYNYAYLYWMLILKVELPEFKKEDVMREYE